MYSRFLSGALRKIGISGVLVHSNHRASQTGVGLVSRAWWHGSAHGQSSACEPEEASVSVL